MRVEVVTGDLLSQPVEAIVNPWNRNTIPYWLLLPQGVSGAIKKRIGTGVFKELAKHGRMDLGQAISTEAGSLPFRRIIHVAGINDVWRASEKSIRASVRNAVLLADREEIRSLAMPLIGAGSGGFSPKEAEEIILAELSAIESDLEVRVVRFEKR